MGGHQCPFQGLHHSVREDRRCTRLQPPGAFWIAAQKGKFQQGSHRVIRRDALALHRSMQGNVSLFGRISLKPLFPLDRYPRSFPQPTSLTRSHTINRETCQPRQSSHVLRPRPHGEDPWRALLRPLPHLALWRVHADLPRLRRCADRPGESFARCQGGIATGLLRMPWLCLHPVLRQRGGLVPTEAEGDPTHTNSCNR